MGTLSVDTLTYSSSSSVPSGKITTFRRMILLHSSFLKLDVRSVSLQLTLLPQSMWRCECFYCFDFRS